MLTLATASAAVVLDRLIDLLLLILACDLHAVLDRAPCLPRLVGSAAAEVVEDSADVLRQESAG